MGLTITDFGGLKERSGKYRKLYVGNLPVNIFYFAIYFNHLEKYVQTIVIVGSFRVSLFIGLRCP